jgi:hypothetical protein
MSDFDDIIWGEPIGYWPDALTEMIATASPDSRLATEFISLAIRAGLDTPDRIFAAADIGAVMHEQRVSFAELAEELVIPPAYVYAVMRGWHRLGVRGLALMAEGLRVPISAFFVDADGQSRIEVRRYHAFRYVAPSVTIMGG